MKKKYFPSFIKQLCNRATIFEDEIINSKTFEHASLNFTVPWVKNAEIPYYFLKKKIFLGSANVHG